MILVVDDNTGNQYVAKVVLELFGLQAHVVENGEEALRAASSGQYELILMDCRMPILDGYEATLAIRRAEEAKGKRTPIIGVTACALEGDREKCLAAGMDDYLPKPITVDSFKSMLKRWIPSLKERKAQESL